MPAQADTVELVLLTLPDCPEQAKRLVDGATTSPSCHTVVIRQPAPPKDPLRQTESAALQKALPLALQAPPLAFVVRKVG